MSRSPRPTAPTGDPRTLSLWHATADDDWSPRQPLPGDRDADVAVVGAGFTGLWTAYYLLRADPTLRVVVLEREVAGFGASGRNGGWCSALFPASLTWLARRYGRPAAVAQYRAMQATVDEVGAVAAAEGIDCHWAKGGTVVAARTPVQLDRSRAEVDEARAFGFAEDDLALLGPDEARARLGATGVLGATYTPHCAAIHPARLVRGLARAVERLGATVHEHTAVTAVGPHLVTTDRGRVRADVVVRATEGYTPGLAGHRRDVAPVYSLMVATEPLPAEVWAGVGLAERETFADHRHLIVYGQRTADDRLAFGGRGAPYHYGSAVRPEHDREPATFAALHRVLVDLLPAVGDAALTHSWGGPLGIARDWCASVGLDPATGLAWAGGYVGDGVATTNLAGRTLTDLVLGRDRWLTHGSAVSASLAVMGGADTEEARTGRPSRRAAALNRLLGR